MNFFRIIPHGYFSLKYIFRVNITQNTDLTNKVHRKTEDKSHFFYKKQPFFPESTETTFFISKFPLQKLLKKTA